jgi:hypothetical protein
MHEWLRVEWMIHAPNPSDRTVAQPAVVPNGERGRATQWADGGLTSSARLGPARRAVTDSAVRQMPIDATMHFATK